MEPTRINLAAIHQRWPIKMSWPKENEDWKTRVMEPVVLNCNLRTRSHLARIPSSAAEAFLVFVRLKIVIYGSFSHLGRRWEGAFLPRDVVRWKI